MSGWDNGRKSATTTWYRVHLNASGLRDRELQRLGILFTTAYLQARCPRGMNLWQTPKAADGIDIYMSPVSVLAAAELISRYRAQACEAPCQPLELIAGHRDIGSNDAKPERSSTPRLPAFRRFLPAAYQYRSVRALHDQPSRPALARDNNQMAPFVRRFVQAWGPLLSPRLFEEDA